MELTIGVRDLRRLVDPVIPCAGTDDMLPVLTCVRIESRGTHLVAMATDRFRLAIKRVAANPDERWPDWSAMVPVYVLRSILATFKPSRRDADPVLTLTIDDLALRVVADGTLLDVFSEAHVSYRLMDGEFPKVRKLIRDALAGESRTHSGFNPALIAGVMPKGAATVQVKMPTGPRSPIVFTDGEDFISILMPRRMVNSDDDSAEFPSLTDWTDLLADEVTAEKPKPKRARKATATREPVSA